MTPERGRSPSWLLTRCGGGDVKERDASHPCRRLHALRIRSVRLRLHWLAHECFASAFQPSLRSLPAATSGLTSLSPGWASTTITPLRASPYFTVIVTASRSLSIALPERSDTKIVLRAIVVCLNLCSGHLGDPRQHPHGQRRPPLP